MAAFRGFGRQHEFEHRNRIAQASLKGTERAVSAADNEGDSFSTQQRDKCGEPAVAPTLHRGQPHVAEPSHVHDAE
jgi:hypothetical protein